MGTVFQIPWARIGKMPTIGRKPASLLHELGFTAAALLLSDNSVSLRDERLKACEKIALVLSLKATAWLSTIARCDYTVKIPMYHEVDS